MIAKFNNTDESSFRCALLVVLNVCVHPLQGCHGRIGKGVRLVVSNDKPNLQRASSGRTSSWRQISESVRD